ncbi:MAG: dolichyl-phosphate beta-D-mannosyltransferase [Candidatus Marinimicrobia bacterium]|nr:dolichyl-phosphate beta-D-mannosyltransferase [Candidatus Neomarinimicrobiota bacterium]
MKILIISPTYNEKENILELLSQIWNINPNYDVLIIDDNSPDGTGSIVKRKMKIHSNLHLIERKEKLGLGTAYCTGFKWALENNYDKIIQMDADLSHNPEDIPRLLKEANTSDVVIGSRYVNGINVVNWPMRRLLLSYFANLYAKIIIGLPIIDATGGFKCFNSKVLKSINLMEIKSEGYSFQIEMNTKTKRNGFSLKEIPIVFVDRTVGKSKMTKKIIYEAAWVVLKLRIENIFRIK